MHDYIVYVNGNEMPGTIKAASRAAAEKKAKKQYPDPHAHKRDSAWPSVQLPPHDVSVVYTEI